MKSVEGTGKGTMILPLEKILGQHFVRLNGGYQLTGRFNSIVANRLLVFADEVKLNDSRTADKLKALISEPTVSMERKGIDPEPIPNFAHFIFASNHDHVLLAGQRERRYLVLEPDERYAQDQEHFNKLHNWINTGGARYLLDYLLNLDISDFDPNHAPATWGLIAEKLQSMKPVQQWCYEWLEKYSMPHSKPFLERLDGSDLAKMYSDWLQSSLNEKTTQRSAETQVGRLMRQMRIPKKRKENAPRFYQLCELSVMRDRFAETLGHSAYEVFTELSK